MRRALLLLGLLLPAQFSSAAAELPSRQAPAAAQTPAPVTLRLRLAGNRPQFRPGETITIELREQRPAPLHGGRRPLRQKRAVDDRALGAGQGWLTRSTRELDELRALCVTESCRSEAQAIGDSAGGTTIQIYRFEGANDVMGRLAQYAIGSLDGLKRKLAQYEPGTRFTLDLRGLDPQVAGRVRADLTRLAGELGVEIGA